MYSQIASNKRRTLLLMAFFVGLVSGLGYLLVWRLGGQPSMTFGVLIGSLLYVLFSYFAGSSAALALNGATEIQKKDNPRLWRIVENLSITDGLPMPKVYIIDDPAPNAFATGRDPAHASVCATTGLLEMMTDTELEGVFAHELGHVKNYDIRVSMIAFALVAVVSLLADIFLRLSFFGGGRRNNDREGDGGSILMVLGLVAALLSPVIATLIQLAISRKREYLADATGALTTRYPEGLASALQKIGQSSSALRRQNTSTAHLFFANPLKGGVANWFSTHPPIQDRIKALREMESKV